MNNIRSAFEHDKAIIVFITCGDPDLETTAAAIQEAVANGANLIELGIPFSDPTAEGPGIQASYLRASKQGVTTDRIFEFFRDMRHKIDVPMVFVTYANVVFSYGAERFMAACRDIGIGGLLVQDLPFEEQDEFLPICRKYGVNLISTIALTSGKRVARIAREAEGLLYIATGCEDAGAAGIVKEDLAAIVKTIRENTAVPCVVDGGSSDAEEIRDRASMADGVVIDLPIIDLLAKYGRNAPEHIGAYIGSLKP